MISPFSVYLLFPCIYNYNIHIIIGYIKYIIPTSSYFYRLNPQEHVDLSMLNMCGISVLWQM